MSWKSAERTWKAFKAISTMVQIHDKYKTVKDSTDLAKKATEIAKLSGKRDFTWDNVKLFKNDEMEKILKQLRKLEAQWKTTAKAKPNWPTRWPDPPIKDIAKLAKKDGINSKKVEAEIRKHLKWWEEVHESAAVALVNIAQHEKRSARIRKNMIITRDYMNVLNKAFLKIAKVPQGPSTAPQAQWVSLSQDALQAKGLANAILGHVAKVDKTMKQFERQSKSVARGARNWWDVAGFDGIKTEVKAKL